MAMLVYRRVRLYCKVLDLCMQGVCTGVVEFDSVVDGVGFVARTGNR